MIQFLKRYFPAWNLYELIWFGTFSTLAIFISVWSKDNLLGFFTFLTGVFCVVLTAKGSIYSFWWGYGNILSYALIAWQNGLYGEMGLNILFFLPVNFAGHWLWRKNIHAAGVLEMRRLKIFHVCAGIIISAAATLLLGWGLSHITGQNTPYLDALTNVLSVIAALLLTFRFREQWLCWIILDIFTVLMWSIRWYNGSNQGAIMVLMWSAYLVNAFYGWFNWSRNSRRITK